MNEIQSEDNEYVEYTLTLQDGVVVACEYAGEGRQAEPLTQPVVLLHTSDVPWPRGFQQLEKRIQRSLERLNK